MSSNAGANSSSGAANMIGSFPGSMAPDAKPETYDAKDKIVAMAQEEIRIAEALRQHEDAVWCGSSQDEPHMWNNLKELFIASIKQENQEPENHFEIREHGTTVQVSVKKKPICYCSELGVLLDNNELYKMETNRYTKEDGISVISVKTITNHKDYFADKRYQDWRENNFGLWRKIMKESE